MNNLLNYFSKEEFNDIKKTYNLYLKARLIVKEVFKEKLDKSGKPYIGHLYSVSDRLVDETEKVAGLLHSIFEHTEINEKDLLEVGISQEILDIVKIVTPDNINKYNMTKEEKQELQKKK